MKSSNPARTKLIHALIAAAELRRDSAVFRRAQMEQIRAMIRSRLCQHHDQRQQLTKARIPSRSEWRAAQIQIRAKLKEISVAAGKARQAFQGGKRAVVASSGVSSSAVREPPLAKGVGASGP